MDRIDRIGRKKNRMDRIDRIGRKNITGWTG